MMIKIFGAAFFCFALGILFAGTQPIAAQSTPCLVCDEHENCDVTSTSGSCECEVKYKVLLGHVYKNCRVFGQSCDNNIVCNNYDPPALVVFEVDPLVRSMIPNEDPLLGVLMMIVEESPGLIEPNLFRGGFHTVTPEGGQRDRYTYITEVTLSADGVLNIDAELHADETGETLVILGRLTENGRKGRFDFGGMRNGEPTNAGLAWDYTGRARP